MVNTMDNFELQQEIMGLAGKVFKTLRQKGPLDFSQIALETMIVDEEKLIKIKDYLLRKNLIKERRDSFNLYETNPFSIPYSLI